MKNKGKQFLEELPFGLEQARLSPHAIQNAGLLIICWQSIRAIAKSVTENSNQKLQSTIE